MFFCLFRSEVNLQNLYQPEAGAIVTATAAAAAATTTTAAATSAIKTSSAAYSSYCSQT